MTETAKPNFITQFPRAFWLINGIELFERGAYYGMLAVLPVYLVVTLGMPAEQAGILFSILLPLLYFVPVLAAPFAEKFGFKAALAVCFAILAPGYALLGVFNEFYGFLLCTILIGVGAGIFKPIAAAMIAQTTRDEQRNFGYAVYYWAINVGAFLTPLAIGTLLPRALFPLAFAIAGGLILLNMVLVFTVFRNVVPPQKDKDVVAAIKGLGAIRHEPKFLVLLSIYAGFWFLYGISLTYLSVYMVQFAVMPPWFNEALLATINPGTIIATGLFTGKLTEKMPSLWLMTAGIAGFTVGFIVLGFTTIPALFIAGVILYSASEFLIQPSFLAYTSKIAPPDKLTIYLGYGFVPIGIGFLASGVGGGVLYGYFARDLGQPQMFWAVIAAVGLLTVGALTLYNYVLMRPKPVEGAPVAKRSYTSIAVALVAILLAPAVVFAGSQMKGPDLAPAAVEGPLDASVVNLEPIEGTTDEASVTSNTIAFPEGALRNATFVLTWTDEPGVGPAANTPDTFILHVTPPGASRAVSSDATSTGEIRLVVDELPNGLAGVWKVDVELVEAGDPSAGPIAIPTAPDTGNAWTLESSYEGSA